MKKPFQNSKIPTATADWAAKRPTALPRKKMVTIQASNRAILTSTKTSSKHEDDLAQNNVKRSERIKKIYEDIKENSVKNRSGHPREAKRLALWRISNDESYS